MLESPFTVVQEDIHFVLKTCHDEIHALSGKTLLITGGSGFVGSYLVETIIAFNQMFEGAPCKLFLPTRSIQNTKKKWPHFFDIENLTWFEWREGTLSPPSDSCDYIIHAASPTDTTIFMGDPYGTMQSIVRTTEQVLEYAKRLSVNALLFMSSGAVYGPQPSSLSSIPETYLGGPDLTDSRSCYGEAKRFAELTCHLSGVPTVIARLFAFVGPHQDQSGSYAVIDFIRQAKKNGVIKILSDGSALRSYCYASDLTISIWKLLMKGKSGEVYNVGNDQFILSILDLADLVAEIIGGVDVEIMKEMNPEKDNRSRYIPDISKLKNFYTPQIKIEEGISRTIQSFYRNDDLPCT